jgi:flagellar biosynthetic protein FliR
LVMTRVSAFVMTVPLFSWPGIPMRIKTGIAVLISFFFAMTMPEMIAAGDMSIFEIVVLTANEVVYGVAMGLTATLIFSSVKLGALIMERQMGLAMAESMNPLTGDRGQPLSMLLETIFILLLLTSNSHHMFLQTISKSFEAFAVGTTPTIATLTEGILISSSTMLVLCLKLSLPMLAAFLVLSAVLGIMARVAPEMNVLFIAMPMKVGLGLALATFFLPFINTFVGDFAGWMNKLLPLGGI